MLSPTQRINKSHYMFYRESSAKPAVHPLTFCFVIQNVLKDDMMGLPKVMLKRYFGMQSQPYNIRS